MLGTYFQFLLKVNPDIIINAAGVTIRRVEDSSLNQIIFTNSLLPNILNKWSEKHNCRLIHFSTDCVFSGKKGKYKENDITDAIDVYGKTKSLGEVNSDHCLTLRSSMVGFELNNKTELLEWVFKNAEKYQWCHSDYLRAKLCNRIAKEPQAWQIARSSRNGFY